MSAETEAAEVILKLISQGSVEFIKISAKSAQLLLAGSTKLGVWAYASKKGGLSSEIANSPNGMAIVTIPLEEFNTFKDTAKKYKLKFFAANNSQEQKTIDICIRTEDLGTTNRIVDAMGITAVIHSSITNITSAEEDRIFSQAKTFEQARAEIESKAKPFDGQTLDRDTNKDFSTDTPYCISKLNKPDDYISIDPKLSEFNGETYTKSTYTVYKDNVLVGTYDDGRFEGRDKSYWYNVKQNIVAIGGIQEGEPMVFFRSEENLKKYQSLARGEKIKEIPIIEVTAEKDNLNFALKEAMEKFKGSEVPVDAQKCQQQALKNGLKSGPLDRNSNNNISKGGVKEWVAEYNSLPGVTPELKQHISKMQNKVKLKVPYEKK